VDVHGTATCDLSEQGFALKIALAAASQGGRSREDLAAQIDWIHGRAIVELTSIQG
jgi:hypothetical protein